MPIRTVLSSCDAPQLEWAFFRGLGRLSSKRRPFAVGGVRPVIRRWRTTGICAFETFGRRLESTLSGRASGHSSRSACDGGSQIRFSSVCANRVRRPEDDDRSTRSYHPPLPHPRNRKRQLPLQEQLGESRQTRKGETSKLDERLTPKPSSSRVSSRWKSRVKSHRKLTQ
jgi:hypothetical protein